MAEFKEVMKQWRRMCKACSDQYTGCLNHCPLAAFTDGGCGAIYEDEFMDAADFGELERRVMKWAKENPEPVYPTWYEWLSSIGVADISQGMYAIDIHVAQSQIPADIAQKLGLKSKEG